MRETITFGQLKQSGALPGTSVREELRRNVLRKLEAGEPLFPGIVGYEESVTPHLVNALLSRHDFILLGLRGQAKSRLLRSLTGLLDAKLPAVAGCEIHDDPFRPICRSCRERLASVGDDTEIVFLAPDERYVEKLATPDVTIADVIGDVDPIRAARGGHDLASELTMHYGLLPRANRGIFALNELPDLAPRIQVGLFNILQEGDVQIKGYPVRLPVDVLMAFSANPEDYTARGKIITPLKDRIGSEIRTHYPNTMEQGVAITQQEAWTDRGREVIIPRFVREVCEAIAFVARRSKKIDQKSGVSQRLPISVLENCVSNAERRSLLAGESQAVARLADVYAALPSLTGKVELEYEGELVGVERMALELIRGSVAEVFAVYMGSSDLGGIVEYFEQGGSLKLPDEGSSQAALGALNEVTGLLDAIGPLGGGEDAAPGVRAAAAEFVLEGLHAQKKIGRSQDRGFTGVERRPELDLDISQLETLRRMKKRQVN